MSAASSVASSSLVVLDKVAEESDTATSRYFAEGAAAFSWPAAERTTSTLSGTRVLRSLCEDHGIPKGYRPYFAHDKVACCADFPGDTVVVYADALDAGMRFPLHEFHAALLRHYGLAPGQLAPNAWRYVAAFVLLCRDAGVEPMLSVFQHFFSICTHKGDASGWHHFKPATGSTPGSSRPRLFTGRISRTVYAGWKSRFFFLQAPPNAPWPCPVKWGKPSRDAVRKPQVTTADKAAIDKLLDRVGSTGTDVDKFLSRRLPVGRIIPLNPELAAVKKEPEIEQTRKRKSPEQVTPRSDAKMSIRSVPGRGSASGGEHGSATRGLSELAQMVEAELHGKERELQARTGEVAQLKKELRAARHEHEVDVARLQTIDAAHAAEVNQLWEEVRTANAEASRLAEELQKVRSEHAAEIKAVRFQHQRTLMSLEHRSIVAMQEGYVMGLRRMRRLAHARYPEVVDPSELKHELLPDRDDQDDNGDLGLRL